MNMPQIIMIVLLSIGLLIGANQHGKPKTGNHNFLINVIAIIIWLSLLCSGGFFN